MFSHGANRFIAEPFEMSQQEVCELTRIALDKHEATVSRIVAVSMRMLKRYCPGLRIVVSYADAHQGHLGKIYQAGNWIYTGKAQDSQLLIKGKLVHKRTAASKYGTNKIEEIREKVDPNAEWIKQDPKFRYVYPLEKHLRTELQEMGQPYPKALR